MNIPNMPIPRPVVIMTEQEPDGDVDLHYTIARLEPATIDAIARRVVELLNDPDTYRR